MPKMELNNNIESEQWLPYTFEGIHPDFQYEVSSLGRVKVFRAERKEWRIQKTSNQKKDGSGYAYFRFTVKSVEGKTKKITKAMHRIVAELFCTKHQKTANYVLHKDYNKANNNFENLQWANKTEQHIHREVNPNIKKAYKKLYGVARNTKLNEAMITQLLSDVANADKPLYKIAFDYGISHTQLNRIRNGKCWPNVKRK